jgi:hypothetical protein
VPLQLKILNKEEWTSQAQQFADYNYRQFWDYSELSARRVSAWPENVAISVSGRVIGLVSVRIKTVPFVGPGIAYVNGGPMIENEDFSEHEKRYRLVQCLNALAHEYCDRRHLLLRIVGPLRQKSELAIYDQAFLRASFIKRESLLGYRSILLDVSPPVGDIRNKLASKWRYNLKHAENNGLTIDVGQSPEHFRVFHSLFQSVQEKKGGFGVNIGPDSFSLLQEEASEREKCIVQIAYMDEVPVAGHIGSYIGDTGVFLFGGSNEEGYKAQASYVLHWNAVQLARAKGCTWYDLGGVDPVANPGVYRFKAGMGGDELSAPGPYDLHRGLLGKVSYGIYLLYRRLQGLDDDRPPRAATHSAG